MILTRYFIRELLVSTFTITGILLLIVISARLIVYLNDAVAGIIPTEAVFLVMLYNLPAFLQLILPLGFFISILLVYGRMYVENEMTVLKACGYGPMEVMKITFWPALLMAAIVGLFSIWLSPLAAQKLDQFYEDQQKQSEFSFLTPGRFNAMGKGDKVSYTQALSVDRKELKGVFIADGETLLWAESGTQFVNEKTGSRYLELHNGKRFDGRAGDLKFDRMAFDSYAIKIAEQSAEAKAAKKESKSSLSLWQSDKVDDSAQLHYRVGLLLLVPIITLIAFPLSNVNPRQGRYSKLLPAILLYMAYYTLLVTGQSVMGDGKSPEWMALWWVHVIFLALGLILTFGREVMIHLRRRARHA